jgi:hypothetical protein
MNSRRTLRLKECRTLPSAPPQGPSLRLADGGDLLAAVLFGKSLLFPSEKEADIAGHSSRILEHLCFKAKAERPEVIAPEFVAELGAAF